MFFHSLSHKLHQILGLNSQAAELEQLDRKSFVVNVQARDVQVEKNHMEVCIYIYTYI